jgi:acetyltransferase-like isoleucine patch superfamily enzyme
MVQSTIKGALNEIRNFLLFHLRYPWVRRGKDIHCQWTTLFLAPHRHVLIGNQVGIGGNCLIQADLELGNKVLIASNIAFLNRDEHNFGVLGKAIWDSGKAQASKIVIEDDVWIGHGAILLAPLRIGRGAIVAAGSTVVKDVQPYAIVAGNPARPIKMRFTPEQIQEHERLLYPAEGAGPCFDRFEAGPGTANSHP